jgi:hypothetical protein
MMELSCATPTAAVQASSAHELPWTPETESEVSVACASIKDSTTFQEPYGPHLQTTFNTFSTEAQLLLSFDSFMEKLIYEKEYVFQPPKWLKKAFKIVCDDETAWYELAKWTFFETLLPRQELYFPIKMLSLPEYRWWLRFKHRSFQCAMTTWLSDPLVALVDIATEKITDQVIIDALIVHCNRAPYTPPVNVRREAVQTEDYWHYVAINTAMKLYGSLIRKFHSNCVRVASLTPQQTKMGKHTILYQKLEKSGLFVFDESINYEQITSRIMTSELVRKAPKPERNYSSNQGAWDDLKDVIKNLKGATDPEKIDEKLGEAIGATVKKVDERMDNLEGLLKQWTPKGLALAAKDGIASAASTIWAQVIKVLEFIKEHFNLIGPALVFAVCRFVISYLPAGPAATILESIALGSMLVFGFASGQKISKFVRLYSAGAPDHLSGSYEWCAKQALVRDVHPCMFLSSPFGVRHPEMLGVLRSIKDGNDTVTESSCDRLNLWLHSRLRNLEGDCVEAAEMIQEDIALVLEMINKKNFNVNIVPDSNEALDLDSILEPLALMYTAMGVNPSHKSEVIKAIKDFPSLVTGGKKVADTIVSLLLRLWTWMSPIIGIDYDLAMAVDSEYGTWCNAARQYLVADNSASVDTSIVGLALLHECVTQGTALMLKFEKAKVHTFTTLLASQLRALEKVYVDAMSTSKQCNSSRTLPVCVYLEGPPGSGKTTFGRVLAAAWIEDRFKENEEKLRRYRENPKQFIYTRSTERWLNGITMETEVIIHDDIGTKVPSTAEDSEWVEIIQEVNEIPVFISQSESDKKGTIVYNQSLTIITGNLKRIIDNFLLTKGAVMRRVHFKIGVSNMDGLFSESHLDTTKLEGYKLKMMAYAGDFMFDTQAEITPGVLFHLMKAQYQRHVEFHKNSARDMPLLIQRLNDDIAELKMSTIRSQLKAAGWTDEQLDKHEVEDEPQMFSVPNKQDLAFAPKSVKMSEFSKVADVFATRFAAEVKDTNYEVSSTPDYPVVGGIDFDLGFKNNFSFDRTGVVLTLGADVHFSPQFVGGPVMFDAASDLARTVKMGVKFWRPFEDVKELSHLGRMVLPIPFVGGEDVFKYVFSMVAVEDVAARAINATIELSNNSVDRLARLAAFFLKTTGVRGYYGIPSSAFVPAVGDITEYTIFEKVKELTRNLTDHAKEYAAWLWDKLQPVLHIAYFSPTRISLWITSLKYYPTAFFASVKNLTVVCIDSVRAGARAMWNPFRNSLVAAILWVREHLAVLTAAFVAIAAVTVGVLRAFGRGEEEEYDDEGITENQESPVKDQRFKVKEARARNKNKMKSLTQKLSKARDNKAARMGEPQSVSYRVSNEIAPAIRRNLWAIKAEDGRIRTHILCLEARRFLIPRHCYIDPKEEFEEEGLIAFWDLYSPDDKFYKVSFDTISVVFDLTARKDLMVVDIQGQIPLGRRIIQHFASRKEASAVFEDRFPMVAIVNHYATYVIGAAPKIDFDIEDEVVYAEAMPTSSVLLKESSGRTVRRYDLLAYELPTIKGSCGSIILCNDKIVAMHTSGNGSFGHASRIDLNDLSTIYEIEADDKEGVEFEWEELKPEAWTATSSEAYDLSCHHGTNLGILRKPSSVFAKEDLVPYHGFGPWPEAVRVPVKVSPAGYARTMDRYREYPTDIDPDIADIASVAVGNHMRKIPYGGTFAPYSVQEAIEGNPMHGFPGMDLTTSPGHPESELNLPRSSLMSRNAAGKVVYGPRWPKLYKEVLMAYRMLNLGALPMAVFIDNVKYELRSRRKVDDPRIVFGSCQWHFILCRCFFGPFNRFCSATVGQNSYAIGMNAIADWNAMELEFIRFGGDDRHMAGDYKGWDLHRCLDSMMMGLEALEHLAGKHGKYGDEEGQSHSRIRYGLVRCSVESVHVRGNLVEQWAFSWASGNYATALLNSVTNETQIVYSFAKIAMRMDAVRSLESARSAASMYHQCVVGRFMGDDVRLAVRKDLEWFNMSALSEVLKDFGDEYTKADKSEITGNYEPREECSFLKRLPYYHKDIDRHVGLMDFDVLTDMLRYTIKNKEREVIKQRADGFLLELAIYPASKWDEWMPKACAWVGPWYSPPYLRYRDARAHALGDERWSDTALVRKESPGEEQTGPETAPPSPEFKWRP